MVNNVFYAGYPDNLKDLNGETIEEKLRNLWFAKGEKLFEGFDHNFALVLYLPLENKFILGRDRFGIEPLYYKFNKDKSISFSQNLVELIEMDEELNEVRIRQYLESSRPGYFYYTNETFYASIFSVLPGHYLVLEGSTVQSYPYWKPHVVEKKGDSYQDFRRLLIKSIEQNTQEYQRVGAQLSGGLDSSSLVLLYAQNKSVQTFYMDVNIPDDEDKAYAALVARSNSNIQHHVLSPDTDHYSCLKEISEITGTPEQFILPASFHIPIAKHAQVQGCQAVLTGHDGDTVVGHGRRALEALWVNQNWDDLVLSLNRLAAGIEHWEGQKHWNLLSVSRKQQIYRNYFFSRKFAQIIKQGEILRLFATYRDLNKVVEYSIVHLIPYLMSAVGIRLRRFMMPKFIKIFPVSRRIAPLSTESMYAAWSAEVQEQLLAATNRHNVYINEELFALGRRYGIKYLFPFLDSRLLELSLGVPESVKFNLGETRDLLRKGLCGDLPLELLARTGKTDFSAFVLASCQSLLCRHFDIFLANDKLWEYADKKAFLRGAKMLDNLRFPLIQRRELAHRLNKIMYLGIWLESVKERDDKIKKPETS